MFIASSHRTMEGAHRIVAERDLRSRLEREEEARLMRESKAFLEALEAEERRARRALERAIVATNLARSGRFRPTYSIIERRICKALGVTRNDISSERRSKAVAFARHAIMYWCARLTPLSLPKIGQYMGGRDHTTILHGKNVYPIKRASQGRTLRKAR